MATSILLNKLKDIVILTKPRITITSIIVSIAGISFAQENIIKSMCYSILGILLLVSGSNSLNMYIERKYDCLMSRTKERPLPSGRLNPNIAIILGVILSCISFIPLYIGTNNLTILLGIFSILTYILIYTPLKRISSLAFIIGAIPGAMPIFIGYISIIGKIDKSALNLFILLFLWQLPHFLAISIFRKKEYMQAGYPLLVCKINDNTIKKIIFIITILVIFASINLWLIDSALIIYTINSIILGLWLIINTLKGIINMNINIWSKKIFFMSIKYKILLFLSLIIDSYAK